MIYNISRQTRKGQYASIHSAFALLPVEKFLNDWDIDYIKKTYQKLRSKNTSPALRKQYQIHERWLIDPGHAQVE